MRLKSVSTICTASLLATILIVSVVPTIQASPYLINVRAWDQENLVYLHVKFWYGGTIVWNPEKQIKELVDVTGPFETNPDGTPTVIGPFPPCADVPIAFEVNPQYEPVCRIKCMLNVFPDSVTYGVMGGALVDEFPPDQEFVPVKVYWIHNSEDVDADVDAEYGRAGPKIDKLRLQAVHGPEAKCLALQECHKDVWSCLNAFCNTEALIFECPCQMRTWDIEKLDAEGFTITHAPAYHVKFMGINIRPDQWYRGSPVGPILSDVNFRHALVHCYNQEEIIAEIKGYTVMPIQSLVPPAQGGWVNPEVLPHPYSPGNPALDINQRATVTGEIVAHADGTKRIFWLEHGAIWEDSETVYFDSTPVPSTAYTIEGSHLIFNSPPPACTVISIDYEYFVNRFPNDRTACGILREGGYLYIGCNWKVPFDIDGDGIPGTWPGCNPGTGYRPTDCTQREHGHYTKDQIITEGDCDDVIPNISLWTPTYEVCPTQAEHGARFVADCNAICIPIIHDPQEYQPYLAEVYGFANFDMYMAGLALGRFPDHLYPMCHSSEDCQPNPWKFNAPGINDPELDEKLETLKFSLNHEEKLQACYEAQEELYDAVHAPHNEKCAFAYIPMYSRIYFNAYKPGLKGIVNSPGYGSDNKWTFLNIHWDPEEPLRPEGNRRVEDGKSTINWILCGIPETPLNPLYAYTAKAWEIMARTMDSLIEVNPYTHADKPWIATDWELEKWATEDDINNLFGGIILGSHWHEDWPRWSRNWNMTSWTDNDVSGDLTIGDLVDFQGDADIYNVIDMTWDIKVERKEYPYDEMKLSGTQLGTPIPAPPTPITVPAPMVGSVWHEDWPTYSRLYTVTGYADNTDGIVSRSDQLWLLNQADLTEDEWHVDSVTVTLHLDRNNDFVEDKVMEFAGTGMKVLFWLREDVFWQDGRPYTAEDARFNWLFLRNNQIPRYQTMWEHIVDVEAVTNYKVVVYLDVTSQFLIYDLACTAAMLPPPVWKPWDGQPLEDILAYDPSTDISPPIHAGPWFGWRDPATDQPLGAVTCLYGTGPFIFDFYDPVGMYAEMHAWRCYWKMTDEIQDQKVEMFHYVGDINYDGYINIFDLSRVGLAYGRRCGQPGYDPDADLNEDCLINARDIALVCYHWGDQREYPEPDP